MEAKLWKKRMYQSCGRRKLARMIRMKLVAASQKVIEAAARLQDASLPEGCKTSLWRWLAPLEMSKGPQSAMITVGATPLLLPCHCKYLEQSQCPKRTLGTVVLIKSKHIFSVSTTAGCLYWWLTFHLVVWSWCSHYLNRPCKKFVPLSFVTLEKGLARYHFFPVV